MLYDAARYGGLGGTGTGNAQGLGLALILMAHGRFLLRAKADFDIPGVNRQDDHGTNRPSPRPEP
jgi:hypothetical protein